MNFASPPAIPISPVSYPPSPESTRQEALPTFPSPHTPLDSATDYSRALSSDPFEAEIDDADDDGAIELALENARFNNEVTAAPLPKPQVSKENAVREILGRFASAPRRPANSQVGTAVREQSATSKAALDVDAFKRMLLTGDRGPLSRDNATQNSQTGPTPVSDSGSSADTASISQHSLFETIPAAPDDSPRTSDELEGSEVNAYRAGLGTISERGEKPPPPKSRRGKPLVENKTDQGPSARFDHFISSLSLPGGQSMGSEIPGLKSPPLEEGPSSDRIDEVEVPDNQKKTPPAPPLARRQGQQAPKMPVLTRSSSSRYSVLSDTDAPPSPAPASAAFKVPPPPPARRSNSGNERRPSIDVASIPEDVDVSYQETRPGLPHTPSYLKRMSQGLPPPLPPPRRGRGSSRSSMDTARPSMASLGIGETEASRSSTPRSDTRDILADIAMLQREVDAARAGAGQ